ncbi:MAG: hypothetical protein JWN44_6714, partial [Myxococcales bacterium]|nr:hypothetical protein [Myxococcales bacterium]
FQKQNQEFNEAFKKALDESHKQPQPAEPQAAPTPEPAKK